MTTVPIRFPGTWSRTTHKFTKPTNKIQTKFKKCHGKRQSFQILSSGLKLKKCRSNVHGHCYDNVDVVAMSMDIATTMSMSYQCPWTLLRHVFAISEILEILKTYVIMLMCMGVWWTRVCVCVVICPGFVDLCGTHVCVCDDNGCVLCCVCVLLQVFGSILHSVGRCTM